MAMTFRDFLHTMINHTPWREESELVAAREAVNAEYPEKDEDESSPADAPSTRTAAGVKNADGSEHNPASGTGE